MEFHAKHGVHLEERQKGNSFVVNICFEVDTSRAEESDELSDTVDYATIFELVKSEMSVPSNLLEHVARRIIKSIYVNHPNLLSLSVEVVKKSPPIKGQVESVSVCLQL